MPYEPSGRNVREDFYVGSMQAALARSLAAGVDFDDIVDAVANPAGGGLSADYEAALGKYAATGYDDAPTLYDPASAAWDDQGWAQWQWVTGYGVDLYLGCGDPDETGQIDLFAYKEDGVGITVIGTGGVNAPTIRLQTDALKAKVEIDMAAAQTASPFVIKDSDGKSRFQVDLAGDNASNALPSGEWARTNFQVITEPDGPGTIEQMIALQARPVDATDNAEQAAVQIDVYGGTGASYAELYLYYADQARFDLWADVGSTYLNMKMAAGQTANPIKVTDSSNVSKFEVDENGALFRLNGQAKPTGVAVTAGAIHAALVTLGLIAA